MGLFSNLGYRVSSDFHGEEPKKEVKKRPLYYIEFKFKNGGESVANTYKYDISDNKLTFKENIRGVQPTVLDLDKLKYLKIKLNGETVYEKSLEESTAKNVQQHIIEEINKE